MKRNYTKKSVIRLKNGDEKAFKYLYERYWSKVYEICFYYTHSREDSEDMLVSIFMSLWNNRDKITIENPEAYLIKAARNQSFKYLQKLQQHKKQTNMLIMKALSYEESDSPDKLLELKELSDEISRGLQSLPEKTRKIFLLNREMGMTYEQIACNLELSEKTVEYHISKALHILSKHLTILFLGLWLLG